MSPAPQPAPKRSLILVCLAWAALLIGVGGAIYLATVTFGPESLRVRLDYPYLWLVRQILVALIAAAFLARRQTARLTLIYLSAATLAVFAWLMVTSKASYAPPQLTEFLEPRNAINPNPAVGYLMAPNLTSRQKRFAGTELLFDIQATSGPNGWRITPSAPAAERSILLLGDSFTWGDGLNDEQTYPWLTGIKAGEHYAAWSFAQKGWGPHQVLSALRHGMVEKSITQPPELAVFLTITQHPMRVKGWTGRTIPTEPRYFLNAAGQAETKGTFGGTPEFLDGFNTLNSLRTTTWGAFAPFSGDMYPLYFATVRAMRDEIAKRFPGCRFEVVIWDPEDPTGAGKLEAGFRADHISVHQAEEFLPDARKNDEKYRVSRWDRHPNALAASLMADFVVNKLLKKR